MKTIIDQRKLQNHSTLANLMSIGGLLILLASVLLPLFKASLAQFSFAMMVVGLGVSMVGIYFANRWVRKPRPEDKLDAALKSLNNGFHLFHYPSLPSDHVLLAPSGIYILETVGLAGFFSFKKGKWKESMTIGRALRYIVEEHLGDPIRAAQAAEAYLRQRVEAAVPSDKAIPIRLIVVFTHPAVQVDVEDAPIPVTKVDKLRKYISTTATALDEATYKALDELLGSMTVRT